MNLKKRWKRVGQIGADLNPGPAGYKADALPQSYRRFDVEMLKIKELILRLPN